MEGRESAPGDSLPRDPAPWGLSLPLFPSVPSLPRFLFSVSHCGSGTRGRARVALRWVRLRGSREGSLREGHGNARASWACGRAEAQPVIWVDPGGGGLTAYAELARVTSWPLHSRPQPHLRDRASPTCLFQSCRLPCPHRGPLASASRRKKKLSEGQMLI